MLKKQTFKCIIYIPTNSCRWVARNGTTRAVLCIACSDSSAVATWITPGLGQDIQIDEAVPVKPIVSQTPKKFFVFYSVF